MSYKENRMADRCMRTGSSRCDPSHITLDLWSFPHTPVNHTVFFYYQVLNPVMHIVFTFNLILCISLLESVQFIGRLSRET